MTRTPAKPALLLLGPTGSGKSPLGALLEKRSRWVHFDFGHELRAIARGETAAQITDEERGYIAGLLEQHGLFPDDRFPLVQKILNAFLSQCDDAPGIILNGLPRRLGQAHKLHAVLDIKKVAVLECSPKRSQERVTKRLRGDSDDHAGRSDDHPKAVNHKWEIFTQETLPLVAYYEGTGAKVKRFPIGEGETEASIAQTIMEMLA